MSEERDYGEYFRRYAQGEADPPPVAELIGFEPVDAGDGTAAVRLEADRRHANPMGTLHGGIFCDIADAAMGAAVATTLEAGESFTTLDLQMSYLRPVWDATLTARAAVRHRGRTLALVECDVEDGEGRLIATARSTCMLLRGEGSRGR